MFKLGLEKAEEPEIKLPTSAGSSKQAGFLPLEPPGTVKANCPTLTKHAGLSKWG